MSGPREPDHFIGLSRAEREAFAAVTGERVTLAVLERPTLLTLAAILWIGLRRALPGLSWEEFCATPLGVLAPETQTARRRAAERWRTGGDDVG